MYTNTYINCKYVRIAYAYNKNNYNSQYKYIQIARCIIYIYVWLYIMGYWFTHLAPPTCPCQKTWARHIYCSTNFGGVPGIECIHASRFSRWDDAGDHVGTFTLWFNVAMENPWENPWENHAIVKANHRTQWATFHGLNYWRLVHLDVRLV